jgi:hypothetical protein
MKGRSAEVRNASGTGFLKTQPPVRKQSPGRTYAPVRKLTFSKADNAGTRAHATEEPARGKNPVRNVWAGSKPRAQVNRHLVPGAVVAGSTTADDSSSLPAPQFSSIHKIGLFSCCAYIFAGNANDLSLRLIGAKAYLSWVFGVTMLVAFLVCGTAFRGLKLSTGKFWTGFALFLVGSSLFSISHGKSVGLLQEYFPKTLFVYFYSCAFALTVRSCRTLFRANILCTTAILVSALLFGAVDYTGRFNIPNSLFFGNSNDFALALVCSLGFSMYLICQDAILLRILGSVEFLASLYFMLKTGSRGGFLALAGCLVVWLICFQKRGRLLAVILPGVVAVGFLPSHILQRLVTIRVPGSITVTAETNADDSSQAERTALLGKAVRFAVTHPVFGTGPGTFPDALWLDDMANGTHTAALGTHNTYAQLAAEDGFPVLFLYLGVLIGSIKLNYRIMKRTAGFASAEQVYTMAGCLLGSLVAYAIATAFDHVAYSPTLPLLSGLSVSLYMATRGGNPQWVESQLREGNA